MYCLKEGKKEELLGGKTIRSLAKILGVTDRHLRKILNENKKCKKIYAMALINIKHGILLNDSYMTTKLNYYFDEV